MVTATGIAPGSEMTAQMEQVEERNVSGVLHVAAIFGSHMVLQRNKPIAVFGALAADCAGMEVVAEIHDFDGSLDRAGTCLFFAERGQRLFAVARDAARATGRRSVHASYRRGQ